MARANAQYVTDTKAGVGAKHVIARRLALSFALVAIVSVAMCGMLIAVIGDVAGLVADMRTKEAAIRESLALATAVREQYIHQAHWIIGGDRDHLAHYEEWLGRVRQGAATLTPLLPESERWRIDEVLQDSKSLHEVFRDRLVPAIERGDRTAVVRHHEEADQLSQRATEQADFIVRTVEREMAMDHASATRAARAGLLMGASCVLLVLGLSVLFTIRLRRAVLEPLQLLSAQARRFGSGDLTTRVGVIGEGELRAVSAAFDKMADELQAREAQLIETERMAAIGQLAAGVAHEVNNPIQVIRGYLKTMGPDTPADVLEEELRILDEEAAACQRIAEDLVAYARVPELHREYVDMEELLREAVRRFGETEEGAEQPVELTVEAGHLSADGGRLRQVIRNLLTNAASFSRAGQAIAVTGRRWGAGGYEIAVSDRGPGIAAEDRTKVFEPFFSKRAGGSGLGLSVCMGIAKAHGGTIDLETNPDGGVTFRVRIPGVATRARERAS